MHSSTPEHSVGLEQECTSLGLPHVSVPHGLAKSQLVVAGSEFREKEMLSSGGLEK